MDEHLQYRFKHLEIAPPGGTWEAIQAKLDEEVQVEKSLSRKLLDYEVEPPSLIWEQLSGELNKENIIETLDSATASNGTIGKVVPFQWRKIAAAAAVLIFIGLTAFFLFFNNSASNKGTTLTTVPGPAFIPPNIIPEATVKNNDQQILATNETQSQAGRNNGYRRHSDDQRSKGPSPKTINASELIQDRYDESIEVYAPLITDESGDIVTNPELLLDSNEQYITVTSPNGEQTRISAKFLGLLDKLYNRSQRAHDEAVWDNKFENWRKKLIVETEFMPASGNYMDILELKELLMEQ